MNNDMIGSVMDAAEVASVLRTAADDVAARGDLTVTLPASWLVALQGRHVIEVILDEPQKVLVGRGEPQQQEQDGASVETDRICTQCQPNPTHANPETGRCYRHGLLVEDQQGPPPRSHRRGR